MHDDSFGYKRHKEAMRHAQSESASNFVACGTGKIYLSGYIFSRNQLVETDLHIHTSPNRSISSHTIEKMGNATKGFTDSSLKANVESNTALYR